jgi:hypothetical protein
VKTLVLDVETAPHLVHAWGLYDQNISLAQLQQASYMLCWAGKWRGSRRVEFKDCDDPEMVSHIHRLVDEADAIVHFNGDAFDMPVLNRAFILAGLGPPSPYKNIDLLKVARKKFKFASNKLEHIAQQLGVTQKLSNEGHSMWVKVMAGDERAKRAMKRYNIGDVRTTEEVYDRLLPWIDQHPNRQLYDGDVCPRCGGPASLLTRQGYSLTNLGKFQRFRCSGCGAWCRGKQRVSGVEMQAAL